MNKYIKPTFMIASLGVTALAGSNCSIQKNDRETIEGMLTEFENPFLESENCRDYMDNILQGYCKFTAGSNGMTQIFFS